MLSWYSTLCFLCFYIRHSHLSFLVWFFVRYCLYNFQFQFVFHTHNKVDTHHAQHALYISGHHTVFNCSGSDTHISPFYGVIIYSTTCCLICCSSLSPTLHTIPPPTQPTSHSQHSQSRLSLLQNGLSKDTLNFERSWHICHRNSGISQFCKLYKTPVPPLSSGSRRSTLINFLNVVISFCQDSIFLNAKKTCYNTAQPKSTHDQINITEQVQILSQFFKGTTQTPF